ncbi:hypothetical protein L207DRAFT_122188 [Hyaloscypha variabilis F]|uniref:Fungal N-terminal domain-containing protein n=1 Tax=Hyaloscypha variabilis (strain UAMH 11265 / GT02V1 / F) TaxID=1149755 RepID=A0A2J6R7T5_HYAVF|nr:hypothetical protein L207DRAFT_122188 [Hyaloscypha variabilis F]
MRELQEQCGNKSSNVIKKLKAAADADRFEKIRTKMASHRGQLVLLMELLGLDLGIAQTQGLLSAEKSIEDVRAEVLSSGTASTTRLADIEIGIRSLHTSIDTSQDTSTKVLGNTQLLRQQLNEVQLSYKSLQGFSSKQADQLDSIMVSMQQLLKTCAVPTPIRKSRKSARHRRTVCQSPVTEPSEYTKASLNHIVNTAVTVQYCLGQPRLQLIAIPNNAFDKANDVEKLYMIKYLQGLRILTWFLREDNIYTSRCYYWSSSSNLWMILEAGLFSSCTYQSFFEFLICSKETI